MKNIIFAKELIFYACPVCGNLIVKLNDSGLNPQCCGRDMERLTSGTSDGASEFHTPKWKMDGCKVIVEVGEEYHPMTDLHYIQWIIIKTNQGFYCKCLLPDMPPAACFKLCNEEFVTEVYSYCNRHKLWMAEPADEECQACQI